MASAAWSTWVKWNGSIEQTLIDAQHLAAGDSGLGEARRRAAKTGLPGILTFDSVSDLRRLGHCWVLSPAELHTHFGSKAPPKKAIEAGQTSFLGTLEEGQAVAVIAYARGVPTSVWFAGQATQRQPLATRTARA
jgi:hypothetical protein